MPFASVAFLRTEKRSHLHWLHRRDLKAKQISLGCQKVFNYRSFPYLQQETQLFFPRRSYAFLQERIPSAVQKVRILRQFAKARCSTRSWELGAPRGMTQVSSKTKPKRAQKSSLHGACQKKFWSCDVFHSSRNVGKLRNRDESLFSTLLKWNYLDC